MQRNTHTQTHTHTHTHTHARLHFYVRHNSFIHVTWLIPIVTWLLHTWDTTHLLVWYGSFIFAGAYSRRDTLMACCLCLHCHGERKYVESRHTYGWVMSYIWMSHVTYMDESRHTYGWVMSYIWMSHVTHMDESRHTHGWVMSYLWMSHVTHMDESRQVF